MRAAAASVCCNIEKSGYSGDIYLTGDKLDVTGMSRIEGIAADVIEGLEDFIL